MSIFNFKKPESINNVYSINKLINDGLILKEDNYIDENLKSYLINKGESVPSFITITEYVCALLKTDGSLINNVPISVEIKNKLYLFNLYDILKSVDFNILYILDEKNSLNKSIIQIFRRTVGKHKFLNIIEYDNYIICVLLYEFTNIIAFAINKNDIFISYKLRDTLINSSDQIKK